MQWVRRQMLAMRVWGAAFALSRIVTAADAALPAGKGFDDSLLIARGHFGLGTPLGILGVSGELSGFRYVALQLGVGHNGEGVQLAATGYGRLPVSDTFALDLGVGVSEGAYEHRTNWLDADHSDDTRWNAAVFLNGELSIETLAKSGFSTRWSLGLGRLVNPNDVSRCSSGGEPDVCTDSRKKAYTVPYLGMQLGYAFSL